MQPGHEPLDLRQLIGIVRRRLPLIALCAILATAASYGYAKLKTKQYTTSASVLFSDNSLSAQIAGLGVGPSSSSSISTEQANNLELIKGGNLAGQTARLVGHGLTAERVAEAVSVSGEGETGIVDISVTLPSSRLAADVANTYARQFVSQQQRANRQYFKSALAVVHRQLAALSAQQRIKGGGLDLEDRAHTLGLLAELNYGNVQVAREALIPLGPSSPKTSKDAALGLLLGLALGLALAFLVERLDDRIRRPEDLQAIYDVPALGAVPKSSALARAARTTDGARALPAADAEAFSLIRAHLRFFNVNRQARTVLVASPASGEGRTTIARHLAEAAARAGTRVLLMEADLRHPALSRQLGAEGAPGLSDVLMGTIDVREATQHVELASDEHGAPRALHVLSAGAALPPSPVELLEGRAMTAVLDQAKSEYELVVIDTPPLTVVSDALGLLVKVDGVVIVGWLGRSRRQDAQRLHQVFASSGVPLLGIVVNGSGPLSAGRYLSPGSPSPLSAASVNGSSLPGELIPSARA